MIHVATVDLPGGLPPYTVHQYLYGYFPQHPRDGARPFLFRQLGSRVLLVSRIPPACPHSVVSLDAGRSYPVEGLLVPIHRRRLPDHPERVIEVPMTTNSERREWFVSVCGRFGAHVGFCQWYNRDRTQIHHGSNGCLITYQPAQVKAMLLVTEPERFTEMLLRGLGRGKAFGYGLLYISGVMDRVATQNHRSSV